MSNTDFSVNGSKELTQLVDDIIKATDWEELRRQNQRIMPSASSLLSFTPSISSEQYAVSINSLNAFKDIATYVFPEGARFKFFKRVIRRFMRVSTNHQQVFNNALLGLLQNIISDLRNIAQNQASIINYLSSQGIKQAQQINALESLVKSCQEQINNYTETEKANQERVDKLQSRMDQELSVIKNRLELLKDAGVDLFSDAELLTGKRSFSQAGEDGIIEYICKVLQIPLNECDYVDLGANHPCYFSNTYFFYQAGARGVLVEANPKLANELRFYRHRDIVLNRFISSKSGQTMDFYILNGDGLSTSDYTAVQEFIKENPALKVEEKIQVESIDINEIFEKYLGHAPKILNVDVEGIEIEILERIDWQHYRPMIVIVEMIPYRKSLYVGEKNKGILELMDRLGYAEFAFTGINSIFIDKESLKELPK